MKFPSTLRSNPIFFKLLVLLIAGEDQAAGRAPLLLMGADRPPHRGAIPCGLRSRDFLISPCCAPGAPDLRQSTSTRVLEEQSRCRGGRGAAGLCPARLNRPRIQAHFPYPLPCPLPPVLCCRWPAVYPASFPGHRVFPSRRSPAAWTGCFFAPRFHLATPRSPLSRCTCSHPRAGLQGLGGLRERTGQDFVTKRGRSEGGVLLPQSLWTSQSTKKRSKKEFLARSSAIATTTRGKQGNEST